MRWWGFDTLLSRGIDKAVEVAKYYDFIEVMPPAIYAPLIAKDEYMSGYRTTDSRFD